MSDDRVPWHRQPGESPAAYDGFLTYRDLGPKKRSLTAAVAEAGRAPTTRQAWGRWSSAHNWLARCAAWDDHMQKVVDQANAEKVGEMAKRHADLAQTLQAAVTLPLNELVRRLQDKEVDLSELPVQDLVRMLQQLGPITKSAVEIERVSRGQPSDRVEIGTPAELQEVEHLRELVKRHQAPPAPEAPAVAAGPAGQDDADA